MTTPRVLFVGRGRLSLPMAPWLAKKWDALAEVFELAALPGVDYACELGEFSRMFNDPFAGIEVVNGELAVPNGPGCVVEPVATAQSEKRAGAA